MGILRILLIAWILILKGDGGVTKVLTKAPVHTLKECIQDGNRNIDCQDFKTGGTTMKSYWPPGPYVIPMIRYGCPESSMHGWREGYISFVWQEPHSVNVHSNTLDVNVTKSGIMDEYFFSASETHYIFLPATMNNMELHFCYKYRSNVSVDIGSWPDENYNIFGADRSCPSEFETHYSNITLPNISRWDSDGYLPDFEIFNEDDKDTLQIKLCSRRKNSDNSSFDDGIASHKEDRFAVNPDKSPFRNWTIFVLIKNENGSCPGFVSTFMFEETIHIEQHRDMSSSMVQLINSLCVYEQITDDEYWLFERRRKYAYSVNIVSLTEGNTTDSSESGADSTTGSPFFDFGFVTKTKTFHFWKIVDLGRTIQVSALDITITEDYYGPTCNSDAFGCFISREKWNFLYSEALSCLYVSYCRVSRLSTSLVFKRITEGRYITVLHKEELDIFEEIKPSVEYTVDVFTEVIEFDGSVSCNIDLGMQNQNIEDDQITASSWLPEHTPAQSRPFSSGWCPQFDDYNPYLKVVFPVIITIEGLTVYNSREVILVDGVRTYVSFGGSLLHLSYSDDENSTIYIKTLSTAFSKLDAEAHTFWFLIPIRAKMVLLSVEKELQFDLTCIRFEVHGCRLNEKLKHVNILKWKKQVAPYGTVAYTSEIKAFDTVLTNIGYPDDYEGGESYKWIVRFPVLHFIKLIFTHIDLNTRTDISYNGASACNDSIIISTDLVDDSHTTRVIDHSFSLTHSLSVETKETQVVLSFITCPISYPVKRGHGFRAIATYQDVPACFSIEPRHHWQTGSLEDCRHPSMFITSMSYLGVQFENTYEQWTIHIPTRRISLQFIEFYVPCMNVRHASEFKIINMEEEKTYCNINRPPDSINSSYDRLQVIYIHHYSYSVMDAYIEGFRLIYTIIEEPEGHLIAESDGFGETKNVAFQQLAYMKHSEQFSYNNPVNLIDEHTFPEPNLKLRSCLIMENNTWWLVDLQDLYTLDYIVLNGAIKERGTESNGNCLLTLSTGMIVYGLQSTGYFCGQIGRRRVISQKGIRTRYLQLKLDCNAFNAFVSLCEVQVYGKLESLLAETATGTTRPFSSAVNGEWGLWSAWTDACFCHGKQYRNRLCDDPKPDFSGRECPGENVSYRPCKVTMSPCYVYNGSFATKHDTCTENRQDHDGFSSWSEWGMCSSDCGHGLMSRTRTCIIPEHNENGKHCIGDDSEEIPCTGTGTCQICSSTFSKCYSIVSKYTNWEQARLECFKRNMTLVTILSLSEMRFVKYLLRERRCNDGLPIKYFNADFYAHIGLQLAGNSKISVPVWENGYYALYFTAWKKNEPSSGNCVRMNFKLFDDDNTWESEDCKHQLSEYTMCDNQMHRRFTAIVKSSKIWTDDEREDIPEQISAAEYEGDMNVTVSGKDCDNSLCRDTKNWGYAHCVNTDGIYEECSIKFQPVQNSSMFYRKYLGKLNTTFSGKQCQRWDSTIPHEHPLHGHLFQGEGISDAANYCRDIGETGFLWCYTVDPVTRWEPCLLNEIKTERQCSTKLKYTGTENSTITGKKCMRWDKQIQSFRNSFIPEVDLTNAENFCRDPFNFGFNWCYVDSLHESEEWEPCQPEEQKTINHTSENSFVPPSSGNFICSDGLEIPQHLRCNGKFDCEDKVDEMGCMNIYNIHAMIKHSNNTGYPLKFEEGSFFRCKSGEWISVLAQCDSVVDCLDASDETNCDYNGLGFQECTKEQFQCDDGDCIHISQVCNFVDDCIDASDEYCEFEDCFLLTEYRCRNGQCIPSAQRCDAIKQCPDGSDETECDTCQSNTFHCDIAVCIPLRLKCDNFEHCEDGSDEMSCETSEFTSCQDAWEAGYRKTGHYTIVCIQSYEQNQAEGDVQAYCQFDDVFEKGTVKTVLDFDVKFSKFRFLFFSWTDVVVYNMPYKEMESNTNFLIFDKDDGNCTQQIIEMCLPTYEAIAPLSNGSVCYCDIHSFKIHSANLENANSVSTCPATLHKNWTFFFDEPAPRNSTALLYTQFEESRSVVLYGDPDPLHQFKAGPAICIHDFNPTDDDIPCNTNGTHIPSNQRCVYDIDASGFPTGCTDGSHLINCETYDCPRHTLKCPVSYCIPYRFLCDGVLHCPGGEDEKDCGCVPSRNEILIIYDSVSSKGPSITQFARQFYTQTSVVRLLSYKASTPLHAYNVKDILLEVHDIEINRSPNIEASFECRYKVFARKFLDLLNFTNDGIKGVILIENSDMSKEVFREMLDSRFVLRADLRIYRVSQYSGKLSTTEAIVANFIDIRVRRWQNLNGIGAEYFSDVCKLTTKVHCPNGYKCSSSRSCIPIEQVCDGHIQCLHGDDEIICDFQCPSNCTCAGYLSNCSATNFDVNVLNTIPKNTRHLDFSFNRKLDTVLQDTLLNFTKLSILNVSSCNIKIISKYAFVRLRNLRSLDLGFNSISVLSNFIFVNLVKLTRLNLQGNTELSIIEKHAFVGLSFIQNLDIANAKLVRVSSDTFVGLRLKTVDLSNNKLEEIENYAFRDSFVENINFDRNAIKRFHKEMFTGLVGLKTLKTPAFKFCCIRPNYVPEQDCYPHEDEFSSCDDLMRHSGLQFMIWLIGIMALLGNALSIIYRIRNDRERLKLGFGIFVTNLAVADFLMAIYLLIIAIADSAFRKKYIYVDDYWRHSVWCNIAGVLSTTSSEASVLFLCLITLDRLLVIKFPFGGVRITTHKATVCAVCSWLFSLLVALLPIAYKEYFKNEFYSKSGVCIALPLTRDRPPGWAYSLALFVCLNFVTFILVALGQLLIFLEMRKSTGIASSAASTRKRDLKVARNLLLVVTTDFLCWFPIGVMGMLALTGHPVSGEVYAWAAVFILPVNSALNPLLYTLSAIIGAKSFSPSTDEQSFTRLTKDIGMTSMKCLKAGHHMFPKRIISTLRDVSTVATTEIDISSKTIATIAAKMTLILDALHASSLGINSLDEKSVLVGVRNKKLTGIVKIKGEPFISYKPEDKQKNIYQLGLVLKSLIAAKKRSEED